MQAVDPRIHEKEAKVRKKLLQWVTFDDKILEKKYWKSALKLLENYFTDLMNEI